MAGPGMVISFLIRGFTAILSGLCFAEFASGDPATGDRELFTRVKWTLRCLCFAIFVGLAFATTIDVEFDLEKWVHKTEWWPLIPGLVMSVCAVICFFSHSLPPEKAPSTLFQGSFCSFHSGSGPGSEHHPNGLHIRTDLVQIRYLDDHRNFDLFYIWHSTQHGPAELPDYRDTSSRSLNLGGWIVRGGTTIPT
ncbi:hypothetical protein BV898_12960 [Hypsibius exemplaris]|uniref:Uncharacterized protein n=1 Tax=Hypsibius exemplaris TaxID=2072580 RepID=A0A1W0WC97_HYPEX|nr:hypothetical protein BV898_12960 [Hypsibius exemplaris]